MMKFKKKTQCLFAFIIAVVMLFIGVSSPSYVYATARNELFQYWNLDDGTDLESYIDSLILHENVFSQELDDETISLFSQYIGFDSLEPSHLTFNTSQLEQERGVRKVLS